MLLVMEMSVGASSIAFVLPTPKPALEALLPNSSPSRRPIALELTTREKALVNVTRSRRVLLLYATPNPLAPATPLALSAVCRAAAHWVPV